MNEHIEVLEAAIEIKNDSIASKHLDMRYIVESGVTTELCQKFEQLSLRDARTLLTRYFNKVVHLRVSESHQQHMQKKLEVQILEQQETIHRLERSLKQADVEKERQLLCQQKVIDSACSHSFHWCSAVSVTIVTCGYGIGNQLFKLVLDVQGGQH